MRRRPAGRAEPAAERPRRLAAAPARVREVQASFYPPGVRVLLEVGGPAGGGPGPAEGPGPARAEEAPLLGPQRDAAGYLAALQAAHPLFRQDPALAREVAGDMLAAQRAGASGEYRPAWSGKPHVLGATDCLLSLCGEAAASLGQDRSVQLLELGPGGAVRGRRSLDLHRNVVLCGAFNYPSCSRLLTGSLDGTVRLWRVPGGEPLACLPAASPGGPPSEVFSVAAEVAGPLVCAGTRAGEVLLWDAERTDLPPARLGPHSSLAVRCAFAPTEVGWGASGRVLLTAGLGGDVVLTDLRAGGRRVGLGPGIVGVSMGVSGGVSAGASVGASAGALAQTSPTPAEIARAAAPAPLCRGGRELTAIAYSPTFSAVAVGRADGQLAVYDPRASGAPPLFWHGFGAPVMDLAFSPRCRHLCAALASWDGSSRLEVVPPPGFAAPRRGRGAGGAGGRKGQGPPPVVYVLSGDSGACEGALAGFPGDVRRLFFRTPGFGARIFTGGVDGEIRVWDGPEGRRPFTERQRLSVGSPVTGLAVSEDGALVVGTDQSGNMRVWGLK